MAVSIPFEDNMWIDIVDYYFDNIHWGQEQTKYKKPADWVLDQYGANVNLDTRTFDFESSKDLTWFLMKWSR